MNNFKFDIIIQAGQSNAEGMGKGPVSNQYIPNDKVYYLLADKEVEHTAEKVIIKFFDKPFNISIAKERISQGELIGDFSLLFAKKYIESKFFEEDRKVLIIRAGVGGTGFKKGNWGINDQLYKKMIEMTDYALSLNNENRVVSFLWHQGEHDAFERNKPQIFEKQLLEMFSSVRKHYGKIPIIAGDFVDDWKQKNIDICKPIIDKIRQSIKFIDNAAFVETQNLLSNRQKIGNNDDIHFCKEALYELGERYFNQFLEIKNENFRKIKMDMDK